MYYFHLVLIFNLFLSFCGIYEAYSISTFFAHHPAQEAAGKMLRKPSPDFLKIAQVEKSIENIEFSRLYPHMTVIL